MQFNRKELSGCSCAHIQQLAEATSTRCAVVAAGDQLLGGVEGMTLQYPSNQCLAGCCRHTLKEHDGVPW